MTPDKISTVVTPVLGALELESVDVVPAGRRRLVRITLDGDGSDGRGPSLDEIAEATRAISEALDTSDVMGNAPYTLEVSSRGTSRPLTEPKHWRRNAGRLVKVEREGHSPLTGRVVGSDDEAATLLVTGEKKKDPDTEHRIRYAEVAKAVVQVELNRKED